MPSSKNLLVNYSRYFNVDHFLTFSIREKTLRAYRDIKFNKFIEIRVDKQNSSNLKLGTFRTDDNKPI